MLKVVVVNLGDVDLKVVEEVALVVVSFSPDDVVVVVAVVVVVVVVDVVSSILSVVDVVGWTPRTISL